MKKFTYVITLLLAASMVVLAGCDPTIDVSGRKVKFTAASKATPATKTAYVGQPSGGWQTIGWVSGNTPDKIRIYCPKEDGVFSYFGDTATWTETDQVFSLDYVYADYTIKGVSNSGHESNASLANVDGNGLIWSGSDAATFYAAYPYSTAICSNTSNQLRFALQIPAGQTGDPADVADMPLLAIQKDVAGGSDVHLDFYPAFSAYEFHLKSADETKLTIDSFTLSSASTDTKMWLTGTCYYDLNRLSNTSMVVADDPHFLKNSALDFDSDCGRSITISVGQEITKTTEATFTLFALPCAIDQMSISVTFTPEGGTQTTKSLKLKKNDNWITFPAGHKALITGLAVEAGAQWNYKIQLDPDSIEWDLTTLQTSFSQNIQTSPFEIENAIENGWTDNHHYYPSGTEDYNIRTLDMNKNYGTTAGVPNKPYFVVTFRPQAPLGGYWRLDPQAPGDDQAGMGTAAFKVEVWDTDSNTGSTDLKGQIMDKTVTLHITSNVTDDQRTTDHAIILKSYFNTSVSFDENSTYSADSEIQDAHKDGSFSFWRFVIPKKN